MKWTYTIAILAALGAGVLLLSRAAGSAPIDVRQGEPVEGCDDVEYLELV